MFFQTITQSEISSIISKYRSNGKCKYANIYSFPNDFEYSYNVTENSLIIKQKNDGFSRLYFLTSDLDELSGLLALLDDDVYVFNIPTKGDISIWEDFAGRSNFARYSKYLRFYNKNISKGSNILKLLAAEKQSIIDKGYKLAENPSLKDVPFINEILVNTFDKYTDYIPSIQKLEQLINNGCILVNRNNYDDICGVLIFITTGKTCYENFWVDKEGLGIYLMSQLYDIMLQNNISVTNLWIADWNENVMKMHKLFGAKPDGIFDYTYIKNNNYGKNKN